MIKALSSMHDIYVFSSLLTDIIVSKLNTRCYNRINDVILNAVNELSYPCSLQLFIMKVF